MFLFFPMFTFQSKNKRTKITKEGNSMAVYKLFVGVVLFVWPGDRGGDMMLVCTLWPHVSNWTCLPWN